MSRMSTPRSILLVLVYVGLVLVTEGRGDATRVLTAGFSIPSTRQTGSLDPMPNSAQTDIEASTQGLLSLNAQAGNSVEQDAVTKRITTAEVRRNLFDKVRLYFDNIILSFIILCAVLSFFQHFLKTKCEIVDPNSIPDICFDTSILWSKTFEMKTNTLIDDMHESHGSTVTNYLSAKSST